MNVSCTINCNCIETIELIFVVHRNKDGIQKTVPNCIIKQEGTKLDCNENVKYRLSSLTVVSLSMWW